MPTELSDADLGIDSSPVKELSDEDLGISRPIPEIKLSPYDQTVPGPFGERLKPESGMEPGTELTTALAGGAARALAAVPPTIRTIADLPSNIARGKAISEGHYADMPLVGPEREAQAEGFGAAMQKPFVPLDLFKAQVEPDDPKWAAAIKEAENMLVGIPEFIESPLGVLTMGTGMGGKAATNLARYGFAADMVKSMFQQVPQLRDNWSTMSDADKGKAISQFLGTGAMAGLLMHPEARGTVKDPLANVADRTGKLAPDVIRMTPGGRPVFGAEALPLPKELALAAARGVATQPPTIPATRATEAGSPDMGDVLSGRQDMAPTPETPLVAPAETAVAAPVEAAKPEAPADPAEVAPVKPVIPKRPTRLITESELGKMSPAEQATIGHGNGIEYGVTLDESSVPDLEAKYKQAAADQKAAFQAYMEMQKPEFKEGKTADELEALSKKNGEDQLSAGGRMNYFGGALMGATRGEHPLSGSNYADWVKKRIAEGKSIPEAPKPSAPPAPPAAPTPPAETAPAAAPVPELVGVGAAVPSEFHQSGDLVSNMFDAIDKDRETRGLPPMDATIPRTWAQARSMAEAKMRGDPFWIYDLIAATNKEPRPLLDHEIAGLVIQRAKWRAELNEAYRRINRAVEDGTPDAAKDDRLFAAQMLDKLELMDKTVGRNGSASEAGRTLNAQKMALDDDMNLVSMVMEKQSKLGRTLTDAERKQLQDVADAYQKTAADLQKQLDAKQAQLDAINAKNALEDIEKKPKAVGGKRAKKELSPAEQQADLTERIKSKIENKQLDEITPLVQQLAKLFSEQGVRGWRALNDAVHGVLKQIIPDLDYRDTMNAVSGHGKFTIPDQSESARALRDAKSQTNEILKIQEVIARQPVKPTGFKRDLPSDIKRRLTQLYENVKRRFGVVITDPATQLRSALQARKSYYTHRMADLQLEINTRKRIVKNKALPPTDHELTALIAEYEKVKAQHDEIFPRAELTDQQKAEREVKSLDRQIAEVQRQLKEGDIFPGGQKERPTSAAIEAKRADLDALKSEREYLREAVQPKTTPEEQELAANEKRRDQLQARIEEAERKINTGDIAAQKAARTPESTKELQNMRDDLDSLNKMVSELRAAVRPGLSDAQRLKAIKARITRSTADKLDRMARGDFTAKAKRPPPEPDAETLRLRAENQRVVKRYRQMQLQDELASASKGQKAINMALRLRRFEVLSGIHSIFKLASYSLQKLAGTPVEEALGAGLTKLPGLKTVGEKSTEVGFNLGKELQYIKSGFTQGIRDAQQVMRRGESDLGAVYDPRIQKDVEWTGFFGRLHLMEKSVLLRTAFERAKDRLTEKYASQNIPVSDEAVQVRIGTEAYQYAMEEILMNPNWISKRVNRFLNSLEEKDKATGRPRTGGQALKAGIEFKLPIRNVPVNYIARTMEYVIGTEMGLVNLGKAFARGIDTLTPSEANVIKRQLTRGLVGSAVMALGYLNPNIFGGYYQPGEKRKAGTPRALMIQVAGVNVPTFLIHNPLLEAAQFGATIRRVADSKLRKRDDVPQGIGSGTLGALFGLLDEAPYVRGMADYGKLRDPRQRGHVVADEVRSALIPQLLQNIAQDLDKDAQGKPIVRKPKTFWQGMELGIPGLRKNVPVAPKPK